MSDKSIGGECSITILTTPAHSAAAFGNKGVEVVGTPALIGFLETAAAECSQHLLKPGRVTVGTEINVRHLSAAPAGAAITANASLRDKDGQRLGFDVEVRWGETILMKGKHERMIVELDRFLQRLTR